MPLKLDVGNSIVNAYALGKSQADERQRQADKLAREQADAEERQATLDEHRRQFDEKQKQDSEQFKIEHKLRENLFNLQQTTAAQDFSKYTEETGNPAQGFEPDQAGSPTDTIEIAPNVFVPRATLYKNASGQTYTARSPQVAAHQKAQTQDTLEQSNRDEVRRNLLYKSALDDALSRNAAERKDTQEDYINAVEFAHTKTLHEMDYRHDLEMQLLRNEATIGKSNANQKDEYWDDLFPLNPMALEQFGLSKGATWSDVVGQSNLEAAGKKELRPLVKIEPKIIKVQEYFEKPFQDPQTKIVTNGYSRYFKGGLEGAYQDIKGKVVADPFVEGIRPELGEIFAAMKELGNYGSAFTASEIAFLKAYAPGAERTLTPIRAKALVDHILESTRQNQIDVIKLYGFKKVGSGGSTSKTVTQTPRIRLNIDIDGNITDQ